MISKAQQHPPSIAALLDAAAAKYFVAPSLARAIAWIESRGDAKAESDKGARGVMQLMPSTAADLGVTDVFDPLQNIEAGVKYFARLLKKYRGDEGLALMAYNAGPGFVDKVLAAGVPLPEQVQQYARNVQARKVEEGGRAAASTPFFGSSRLELQCPYCSKDLSVELTAELRR